MLTAMYPSEDELVLDNPAIVFEINEWMEREQFKVKQAALTAPRDQGTKPVKYFIQEKDTALI